MDGDSVEYGTISELPHRTRPTGVITANNGDLVDFQPRARCDLVKFGDRIMFMGQSWSGSEASIGRRVIFERNPEAGWPVAKRWGFPPKEKPSVTVISNMLKKNQNRVRVSVARPF